ncbi:Cna protein B-type domain-containing protein [Butyrivibrio sp. Su6]|uniref:SpaA isopeptide-forming pilin-related protein n=1 Tax=Butyrivibrio sp. Su6 TaxID=1520810 RepID=UPI00089E8832|nr:SpaA isopeptide-forming pilin-related protein [Butyrivibrio sp. Su6]SEF73949.1 Cna protein B-type domain-containing protein [Butyrivibrio sp. Su6]
MRGETENRAEKYIRNHKNRKKWLAFVLCLSLFTGTATLYGLNKPATAMTEEGAGQVGLVMETADNEFEQGLIEQMQKEDEESGEGSVSLENEEGTAEETSNEESGNATPETVSENGNEIQEEENSPEAGAAAATSSEASNAASSEDESGISSSASSASTVKDSASEASGMASSGSSLDAEKSTSLSSGKAALDIPESVDLLEYVTETIIERKNADGEWEVIDKDDIKPADKLRITFNYVLPKEAVVSDDIHLEIPEEFGTAETDTAELDDGKGSYEVTEDNQLIIQYSDEVKEEIISEAGESEEENSDEATSLIGRIDSFFDLFSLTAYAADSTSGSATVYTTVAGMTITGVTLVKNPDEKGSGSSKTYSGGTPISSGAEVTAGDKLYFTIEYTLAKNTVSAENPTITYDLAEHGIEVYEAISGMVYNSENEAVGTFSVEKSGLVTITYYPEFAAKNSTQEIEGDFYFVEMANANSDSEKTYKEYVFDDDLKIYIYIVKGDSYDLTLEKKASSYDETNKTIDYTIVISSNNGTGTSGITLTDVLTVYNNSLTDKNLNSGLTSDINLKNQLKKIKITKSDGTNIASGNAVSVGTDGTATISLPDLGKGESYTITYTFNVPDSVAGTDTPVKVNNSVKAVFDEEKNRSYTVETDINGNVPNIDKYGTADTANKTVTWTIKLNSLGNNLNGYTLKDFVHTLAENGWEDVSTPYVGKIKVSSVSTPSGKTASLKVGQEISLDENGYKFTSDDYSTYEFTYTYTYTVFDLKWGSLVNEASITRELNGKTYGDDKTASVYTGDNTKVVEKKADGIDNATDDASTVLVKWNVTIHAPIKCNEGNNNSEYWSFTDAIQDSNEYLSESQLSDLEAAIRQAGYSGNISVKNGEEVTVGGVSGYKGFVIRFYSDLTTDLEFTYNTTGYIGEGNNTTSFQNYAYVRSQSYSSTDTQNYEPIIAKYDGKGTHSDSAYDYYSEDLLESGILTWRIKINIPEICNYETLTATDTLPDGVSLIDSYTYKETDYYGLEIADNDSFNGAVAFSGGSATYLNTSFYESIDGQNVKVTFSPSNLQGKTLYLRVRAKIDDPDWTSATNGIRTFTNSVSLKNEGGNELGGDSQTQNITKTETALEKTSNSNLLDAKDTIEYTLEVNENAADLLEGSDELTLTDTLRAKSQSSFGATLVAGHIKVYEVITDSAGNETLSELSTDEYSYSVGSYETKASYWDNSGQDDGYYLYNTIEFKIPDKKHLRIVYRYTFNSDSSGQVSILASNKATLKGIAEDKGSSDSEKTIILEEAGAKADVHGINIYKVDNENNAIVLGGAEFALYKWTGSSWQRIIYDSSSATWKDSANNAASEYISGEDGLVALQHLTYNQAYKLVETKAPKGYLLKSTPLYFYMPSADTTTYSMNLPSGNEYTGGNEIVAISQGTDYNFTNTKTTTSITINKYWENEDETMPDSITVKLGRRTGAETSEISENYWTLNVDHRSAGNNVTEYKGYPSVKDGSKVTVSFTASYDYYHNFVSPLYVKVNDSEIDLSTIPSDGTTLSYTFTIHQDTTVLIKDNWNVNYSVNVEIESPTTASSSDENESAVSIDEKSFMTLTLTKSGKWTTTIDNLERYYYVYDDDGNIIDRYLWLYYVSEVNNVYYTAEYTDECKTGINSGTLEFTNKRNELVPTTLPETGGIGERTVEMAGFGLVLISLAGMTLTLTRRKKKAHFGSS